MRFQKLLIEHLLIPEIKIDAQIDLKDITPKFYRIIKQFAPFGPENMTPVFMTENLTDTGYGKCVGEDKTHLRMTVTQPAIKQFGVLLVLVWEINMI